MITDEQRRILKKLGVEAHITALNDDTVVANFFTTSKVTDDDGFGVGDHIGFLPVKKTDLGDIVGILRREYPEALL